MLLKKTHGWGARKLHRLLRKQVAAADLPCRSTVFDILKRHGLVKSRRRRQKWQHPGAAPLHTDAPNEVWTIDFKGQFKTRDGIYCYPLTLLDHYSRYLLACRALFDVKTAGARATLEQSSASMASRRRSAATTARHSRRPVSTDCARLNVWWMKLGIVHRRIGPSSPQENGAHERMHKTLKARQRRHRRRVFAGSSRSSTASKANTTSSDPTKPSTTSRPRRSGLHRNERIPIESSHPSTPVTSSFVVSATRATSRSARSTTSSAMRSRATTSASSRLTMASGTSSTTTRSWAASAAHRQDQRGFVPLGRC